MSPSQVDYPLRQRLNDEFHARPPIPLIGPVLVTHLAFLHNNSSVAAEHEHLSRLAHACAGRFLERSGSHLMLDLGSFRIRWELHTEFSSYTVFRPLQIGEALHTHSTALDGVSPDWLAAIPGQRIVATHIEVRSASEISPESITAGLSPTGQQMVASQIVDGAAWVFTDFLFEDGFSRFRLLDISLTQRQAGRTVQRLLEIETYRLMALLGLPVAQEIGAWLPGAESELADLMDRIGSAKTPDDEFAILERLSRLAAEVERAVARTAFRFGASRAYHDLVMQRINELREVRVSGFPTFHEFMERRLLPPMSTCLAMARRQDDLSGRVARNSQLLRTRVDIELEKQNQELLGQMNQRARQQLRLQETVEGLSVVAITYYGSQLVHYLVKGLKPVFPELSAEVATALAIPLVALLATLGLRQIRRRLTREEPLLD